MICDVCKKNKATVHLTQIINGVKKEYNLCENCAKEINTMSFMPDINFGNENSFQNVLGGLIDYISGNSYQIGKKDIICKNCGMSYQEFKNNGLLGCSQCYTEFKEYLNPVVKRLQGSTEHIGKIPKKTSSKVIQKKKLIKLKEDLNKAVAMEEYEKAAEIRDKIKELKNISDGGEL
ncbi:MAG: UvrB/UvrC motif-containing protein [Bacillota bacterium]|nr:UvrB/UvrC motif-containing protein [Bacillota bacterium]